MNAKPYEQAWAKLKSNAQAILGPAIIEEPTEIDRVAISRFMAAMGRKGGKPGGKARAAKRTPRQSQVAASNAAKVLRRPRNQKTRKDPN
jgi:hypothetical protein